MTDWWLGRRKERYFAKVQAEKAAALAAMPVTGQYPHL